MSNSEGLKYSFSEKKRGTRYAFFLFPSNRHSFSVVGFSFFLFMLISSCTTQKELTYLNNLDTAAVSQFYPLERPDYRIQYQDILYVNFFTMNLEMNELLNPGAGTTNSSYMFRDESSIYIYGPGRAVRYLPAPPQIRTSGFSASGSSAFRFAIRTYKNA